MYDEGDAADTAGCSRALDCDGMLIKVIVSVRTNFFLRETIFLGFLCVRSDFLVCLRAFPAEAFVTASAGFIGDGLLDGLGIDGDLDFRRMPGGDCDDRTTLALARAAALSRM